MRIGPGRCGEGLILHLVDLWTISSMTRISMAWLEGRLMVSVCVGGGDSVCVCIECVCVYVCVCGWGG